ncbi:MAG: hypothetical protein KIT36_11685 [Alphaproteobacteria bacterium]|nr:hypothetical protein [Alphaproteobacteria bacterium]
MPREHDAVPGGLAQRSVADVLAISRPSTISVRQAAVGASTERRPAMPVSTPGTLSGSMVSIRPLRSPIRVAIAGALSRRTATNRQVSALVNPGHVTLSAPAATPGRRPAMARIAPLPTPRRALP